MDPDDTPIPTDLTALPTELPPPPGLEHRTVSALTREGLLRPPSRSRVQAWQVAAALALFVGGIVLGRVSASSPTDGDAVTAPRFLLLLHGGPTGLSDADERAVVIEYASWAGDLRRQGRVVSGERLADTGAVVPEISLPDVAGLRGYFLITADSFDDALGVARACPHARRGGHVIVRPIDPT